VGDSTLLGVPESRDDLDNTLLRFISGDLAISDSGMRLGGGGAGFSFRRSDENCGVGETVAIFDSDLRGGGGGAWRFFDGEGDGAVEIDLRGE